MDEWNDLSTSDQKEHRLEVQVERLERMVEGAEGLQTYSVGSYSPYWIDSHLLIIDLDSRIISEADKEMRNSGEANPLWSCSSEELTLEEVENAFNAVRCFGAGFGACYNKQNN